MKKSAKLLIFTLIVTVMLAFSGATALAADYNHCAEALAAMGLFQGSESGFQLDREATRAEASVMLVRLLGAEQEALDSAYSHPFTDVPDWATAYIGYMYEKGLTKGVSATTFNPQGICDLRMFSAFVLRALGYTDAAGDYTYAEAESFAMNLGVVDIITGAGDFTRDNLAAISYTALFVPTKGADTMLLAQLIEQGVVTEEAAKPYMDLYNTYALIQKGSAKMYGTALEPQEMKLDMTMKMDMGEMGNVDITLNSLIQMDASAISATATIDEVLAALDKLKFSMTNKIALAGEEPLEVAFDLYMLDNVLYIDNNLGEVMADETIPAHMKVDVNTLLTMMQMSGVNLTEMMKSMESFTSASWMPANPYATYYGIAMITDIKSESLANGGSKLNVAFIDIPNEMITSIISMIYGNMPEMMEVMNQMDMDCQISDCSYTLDKDGNLTAQSVTASVKQAMFAGTDDAITAQTDMQMSIEITKTGAAVKIAQPAKDVEYVDLMQLLTGGGTAEEVQ